MAVVSLCLALVAPVTAREWLTGDALVEKMDQPVSLSWSGIELREAVTSLSTSQRTAALIDRRVDPNRQLAITINEKPLSAAWRGIAQICGAEACFFDSVVYLGPVNATARLRTLAALRTQEASQLADPERKILLERRAWQWEDLATPRELLEALATDSGLRIMGLDRVPHDLWAGADLPPLSLVERLTLLLTQFDLTFQFADQGRAVEIVPVPPEVAIERFYPTGGRPEESLARLKELATDSQVELAGTRIRVTGPLEDHERIRPPRTARRPSASTPGEKRLRLNVESVPLDKLLEELAKRLDLELSMDRAQIEKAGVRLTDPVSVQVEDATLEELFKAALEPSGLTFTLEGKTLKVMPRK